MTSKIEKKVSKKGIGSAIRTSHIIPKSSGIEMTARFSESQKDLNQVTFFRAIEFDKSLFEKLIKLKGCKKIRIYNAVNAFNEQTFVITAVDTKKNDIYFKIKTNTAQPKDNLNSLAPESYGVGNMGNSCPQYTKDIITL
jgi:hypothetical protein